MGRSHGSFERMLLFAPREDALAALSCADGQDPDLHVTPEAAGLEVHGRVQGRRALEFSRNFTTSITIARREGEHQARAPHLSHTLSRTKRPCHSRALLTLRRAAVLRCCGAVPLHPAECPPHPLRALTVVRNAAGNGTPERGS